MDFDIWAMRELQIEVCKKYSVNPCFHEWDGIAGISKNVSSDIIPINGFRHPVVNNTSGWYIYNGQQMSKKEDFFTP